jgi:hypothetical protein
MLLLLLLNTQVALSESYQQPLSTVVLTPLSRHATFARIVPIASTFLLVDLVLVIFYFWLKRPRSYLYSQPTLRSDLID